MKKSILVIIILYFSVLANSQGFHPEINVGLAIRGSSTPLEKKNGTYHPYDFFYSSSKQFRCNSLALGIAHEIFNKNWRVEVSNYIRYNYFRDINLNPASQTPNVQEEKRLKTDHFLDLYYYPTIGKKKNWKLKFGAGYGITNTGTGFTYPRFTDKYDASGNPIFEITRGSFQFSGLRAMLGAEYKKVNATITVHESKNNNNEALLSIWIETKLAYRFKL